MGNMPSISSCCKTQRVEAVSAMVRRDKRAQALGIWHLSSRCRTGAASKPTSLSACLRAPQEQVALSSCKLRKHLEAMAV